jgi:hypothetical protein
MMTKLPLKLTFLLNAVVARLSDCAASPLPARQTVPRPSARPTVGGHRPAQRPGCRCAPRPWSRHGAGARGRIATRREDRNSSRRTRSSTGGSTTRGRRDGDDAEEVVGGEVEPAVARSDERRVVARSDERATAVQRSPASRRRRHGGRKQIWSIWSSCAF